MTLCASILTVMKATEINPKPYLPRTIQETREEALARVRDEHGVPTIGWEDRPVKNFEVPSDKGLMERIRGQSRRLAPGVAAVTLLVGVAYEGGKYVMGKDHQVQQIQQQKDRQAMHKGLQEQAQELGNTSYSP